MKLDKVFVTLTTTFLTTLFFEVVIAQDGDPLIVDAGVLGRIRGLNGVANENGTARPYIQFRSIPYASHNQRFLVMNI